MAGQPPASGYEGQVNENQKPHGFGIQRCANGDIFEGNWANGRPHGRGTYKYVSGAFYDGDFSKGQRHGTGVYAYANGQVYDGEWQNGKRHGTGSFCSNRHVPPEQADIYEGEFVEGMQHGAGTTRLANGDTYKGQYQQGKRHGQGVLVLASGDKHQGFWYEDTPHGFGAYSSKTLKRHFVGTFQLGILHEALCVPKGQPAKPSAPPCAYPDDGSDVCVNCNRKKQQCPSLRDPSKPQPMPLTSATPSPAATLARSTSILSTETPPSALKSPTQTPKETPSSTPTESPVGSQMVDGDTIVATAKRAMSHVVSGMGLAIIDQESEQMARTVVRVVEVASGGPLDHLNLQKGDYIVKFNGKSLRNRASLLAFAQSVVPGTECELGFVSRDAARKENLKFVMGCNVTPVQFKFLRSACAVVTHDPNTGAVKRYPSTLLAKMETITVHKRPLRYEKAPETYVLG